MRRVLLASFAVLAVMVPGAHAAPTCNQLVDRANDVGWDDVDPGTGPVRFPSEGVLDLVSADVASDGTTVAAAVRVRDLGAMLEPLSPLGSGYLIRFTVGSARIQLDAWHAQDGDAFYATSVPTDDENSASAIIGTDLGPISGAFDVANDEIRMWLPKSQLPNPAAVHKGAPLKALAAWSQQYTGSNTVGSGLGGDMDFGSAYASSYTIGTPSCVPIGR